MIYAKQQEQKFPQEFCMFDCVSLPEIWVTLQLILRKKILARSRHLSGSILQQDQTTMLTPIPHPLHVNNYFFLDLFQSLRHGRTNNMDKLGWSSGKVLCPVFWDRRFDPVLSIEQRIYPAQGN